MKISLENPDLIVDVPGLLQKAVVFQLNFLFLNLELLQIPVFERVNILFVTVLLFFLDLVTLFIHTLLDSAFFLLDASSFTILCFSNSPLLISLELSFTRRDTSITILQRRLVQCLFDVFNFFQCSLLKFKFLGFTFVLHPLDLFATQPFMSNFFLFVVV